MVKNYLLHGVTIFEEEKGESMQQVLYFDGENTFVVVMQKGKKGSKGKITPGILKLDKTMKPVARENYTVDQDDMIYKGIRYYGGQFLFLMEKYEKKSKTTTIYGIKINKETLKTEGGPIELVKVEPLNGKQMYTSYSVSEDSNSFVIKVTPEMEKGDAEKFYYKILDKNLKLVTEKYVEMQGKSKDIVLFNIRVNSKNQVYVMGKKYKEFRKNKESIKSNNGEKIAGYELFLMRINPDGSEKEYKIDLTGKFFDSYSMTFDQSGNPHLCVLFNTDDGPGVKGYLYFQIDSETASVTTSSNHEFPLSFIEKANNFNDDNTKSKNPTLHEYFGITEFKVMNNGNVSIILEKNFTRTVQMKNSSYTIYNSQSIIPILLNSKGEQLYCLIIPKIQFYNELTNYQYHSTFYLDDKVYILWNDMEENVNFSLTSRKQPKKFNELKKMILMMAEIDATGKMERNKVATSEQLGTYVCIPLTKQVSEQNILLYGFNFKKKINKLGIGKIN